MDDRLRIFIIFIIVAVSSFFLLYIESHGDDLGLGLGLGLGPGDVRVCNPNYVKLVGADGIDIRDSEGNGICMPQ